MQRRQLIRLRTACLTRLLHRIAQYSLTHLVTACRNVVTSSISLEITEAGGIKLDHGSAIDGAAALQQLAGAGASTAAKRWVGSGASLTEVCNAK